MAIYALADLHLSLSNPDKSMDVFGPSWKDYIGLIKANWEDSVSADDTVLIAGDISWATYISKAEEDFEFLSSLPGRKLISRGNHDYWWTSKKKMDEFFESHNYPGIEVVRTNLLEAEGCLISGTRGWTFYSQKSQEGSEDRKIYDRELLRIGLCLKEFETADPEHKKTRILMIHYPPLSRERLTTAITELLKGNVDICVYGHLHGNAHKGIFEGESEGVRYICTSSDYLGFKPVRIL